MFHIIIFKRNLIIKFCIWFREIYTFINGCNALLQLISFLKRAFKTSIVSFRYFSYYEFDSSF